LVTKSIADELLSLCIPNEHFTIGYKICTFASLISPVNVAHLWLFNADCGVIGEATRVNVFDESPDSIDISATEQIYTLNSQLIESTSVNLKDGRSPVTLQYEGMSWGGKEDQCWFNDREEFICSFEFDC
jgi:hypothetical protein